MNDHLNSIEITEFNFDRYNPLIIDPNYFENKKHEGQNIDVRSDGHT